MSKVYFTQNETWGFFGTCVSNYGLSHETAQAVFSKTCYLLMQANDAYAEDARAFLDSKWGRHFADELSFHGAKQGSGEKEILLAAKKALIATKWVKNHFNHRPKGGLEFQ